jgi:transcription elongation factor Elf1
MKIKRIISQHRRDFTAEYQCEHCGWEFVGSGYDDTNFHKNVVPTFICQKCQKTADDSYRPLATMYPDGYEI